MRLDRKLLGVALLARGVLVKGSSNVDTEVTDNYISGGGGIVYSYSGASRTLAARNTIIGALGNGMSGTGNGGAGTYNKDCRVVDNVIISPGRMGIEDWSQCRDTVIKGNIIQSPGALEADGFGISAVGEKSVIEGNEISDYLNYGIEANGAATAINNNRIRQVDNGKIHTGVAIIINAHGTGVETGAVVVNNAIDNSHRAISVIESAGHVVVSNNTILDSVNGVNINSTSAKTSFHCEGNVIKFTPPISGTTQRSAFNTYSTNNTGCKFAKIVNNLVQYESSAGPGTSSQGEWFVKVSTDNVLIAMNVFDAGGIANAGGNPRVGGVGVTSTGLAIIANKFLNGATFSTAGFTSPTVIMNDTPDLSSTTYIQQGGTAQGSRDFHQWIDSTETVKARVMSDGTFKNAGSMVTQTLDLQNADTSNWYVKGNSYTGNTSFTINDTSTTWIAISKTAGVPPYNAIHLRPNNILALAVGYSSTNPTLGFYGTTPITRPTGTPAAATDATTTQALVNDIRAKLLALGLIV